MTEYVNGKTHLTAQEAHAMIEDIKAEDAPGAPAQVSAIGGFGVDEPVTLTLLEGEARTLAAALAIAHFVTQHGPEDFANEYTFEYLLRRHFSSFSVELLHTMLRVGAFL